MVTTRSSQESPQSAAKSGNKRAANADASDSPKAKRGKTSAVKDQKTIEETMNMDGVESDAEVAKQLDQKLNGDDAAQTTNGDSKSHATKAEDEETDTSVKKQKELEDREAKLQEREEAVSKKEANGHSKGENGEKSQKQTGQPDNENKADDEDTKVPDEKTAFDEVKADEQDVKDSAKAEESVQTAKIESNNDSVIEDSAREEAMPSAILEKGIIYFFFRGRVGVEDPKGVDDLARSYIVLRPLPIGAQLGDGPLQDDGKARLLALPKKVLPKSKRDKFLMFVEKAKASIKDLKDDFISGSEYATKTAGYDDPPLFINCDGYVYTDDRQHLPFTSCHTCC